MVEQAVKVVHAQVEAGEQVERILRAQILAGVVRVALRGIEAGHVAHLELGAIGPGLRGQIDQATAQFDIAVMVVADFGDDVAGVARPDQAPVDGKFGLALTRDGDQVLVFVDQRDEADLGIEPARDLVARGLERQLGEGGVGDGLDRQVHVDQGGRGHPAANVAIGHRADHAPALADHDDEAGLVGRDLLEADENRVFGKDAIGRRAAVDDHATGLLENALEKAGLFPGCKSSSPGLGPDGPCLDTV